MNPYDYKKEDSLDCLEKEWENLDIYLKMLLILFQKVYKSGDLKDLTVLITEVWYTYSKKFNKEVIFCLMYNFRMLLNH